MSRIKYRVAKNGNIYQVLQLFFGDSGIEEVHADVNGVHRHISPSYEVLRYSGRTDINGEEIYAGDLITNKFKGYGWQIFKVGLDLKCQLIQEVGNDFPPQRYVKFNLLDSAITSELNLVRIASSYDKKELKLT